MAVRYIYDGMLAVAERDSAGNTLAAYTRIPDIAGGIGGLVSRWNGTATHYYHNIMLDNVTRISDESGSIAQAYDYDAFGNITAQTGSLINKYQFQDKETLEDFGLVFYGARYYQPKTGRFINTDPLGMVDGPNLYRFCVGDPVNYLDSYGLYVLPPEHGPGQGHYPPVGGSGGAGSGIDYGDIHGEKPDTQPGAEQINSGGCGEDGGGSVFSRRKEDDKRKKNPDEQLEDIQSAQDKWKKWGKPNKINRTNKSYQRWKHWWRRKYGF